MESSRLLTAVNSVIACLAILGNSMVIVVMTVRRKQFGSFTNRLIRHQSITDFVSGALFITITVGIKQTALLQAVDDNLLGEILCRFIDSEYFIWAANVASTYNLVIISIERFMATCHPVKHRNTCSLFRIKVSMCAAWIIGFTYAINITFVYHAEQGMCTVNSNHTTVVKLTITTVAFLVEYLLPVILMTFAYVNVLYVLRRKLAGTADVHQQRNCVFGKAKRNVLVTMLLTGSLFVICWTPMQLLRFLNSTGIVRGQHLLVFAVAFKGFVMCNMCVNPFVYCFKYEHFRVQLMQLLRGSFRRNRVQTGEESNAPSLSIDPLQQTTRMQSS